ANGDVGLITSINGVLSTYAEQRGFAASGSAPVLASAVVNAQGTLLTGSISGMSFTRYDIDVFANDAFDPSGFGEGQRYLQSISVLIDDSGSAQFQVPLAEAVPVGQWITATATST